MSTAGTCSKCGGPINPDQDYREVTGLERIRARGRGGVRLIDRTGETLVCRWCLNRLEKGLSIGQGTLI